MKTKPLVKNWIIFIALRYFRVKRKARGLAPAMLSVVGIGAGVLALITVIGVMNGFQLGFIENILAISSYHLRISPKEENFLLSEEVLTRLRGIKNVSAVLSLMDVQALVKGQNDEIEALMLRGVPRNILSEDSSFNEHVQIVAGSFDLAGEGKVVLGAELSASLGVTPGDEVTFLYMGEENIKELAPKQINLKVSGVFKSGYYEYDRNMAFVGLEDSPFIKGAGDFFYGVKLANRNKDREAMLQIKQILPEGSFTIESWREYNRSFFGALRTEKVMMTIILNLIFVVVGVNIFHSLKRTVHERIEEIGVLKSFGAPAESVRSIFILEGVLIGLMGTISGLLAGFLISDNINALLSFFKDLVNGVLGVYYSIASLFGVEGNFKIYPPGYYYLSEIPSKVLFSDTFLVVVFALSVSIFAAFAASKKAVEIKPAEVLHYE